MATESLPVELMKHPLVWSGLGLMVRYTTSDSPTAPFWRQVGLASLAVGLFFTVAERAKT